MALQTKEPTLVSSQAGFLPIPLRSIEGAFLADLPVYYRRGDDYELYQPEAIHFGERDVERLLEAQVEVVYVPVKEHRKYCRAIERNLPKVTESTAIQQKRKAEIVYATAMELTSQLLEPRDEDDAAIGRAANAAKALVKTVLGDSDAFKHLFAVANHDFHAATHMVNVCAYSLSLARTLDYQDKAILEDLAVGALLHDIGKLFIPSETLNSTEKLSADEFELLRSHVMRGVDYLSKHGDINAEALRVIREHHERLDGSGYPAGLAGKGISPLAQIVAVTDSFDAMTSVHPYREYAIPIENALGMLRDDAPLKYDEAVVEAFAGMIESQVNEHLLLQGSAKRPLEGEDAKNPSGRRHQRHYFRVSALLRVVSRSNGKVVMTDPKPVTIHNMSYSGVGFIAREAYPPESNVCLAIPQKNGPAQNVVAMIVRTQELSGGWYCVAGQFYRGVSEDDIDALREIRQNRLPRA